MDLKAQIKPHGGPIQALGEKPQLRQTHPHYRNSLAVSDVALQSGSPGSNPGPVEINFIVLTPDVIQTREKKNKKNRK